MRSDGRTDTAKLIVAFRNTAKAAIQSIQTCQHSSFIDGSMCFFLLLEIYRPHSSKIFVLFYVLFVLCRSVYCLCVNVYCTTTTG